VGDPLEHRVAIAGLLQLEGHLGEHAVRVHETSRVDDE
jgi:hypothetical protein